MKWNKKWKSIILLLSVVSLSGCGKLSTTDDFTISNQEQLTIYTSHKEEVYGPIIKEFEERTGIWVKVVAGGTNELLEKIAKESGTESCDVMFGGGVENLEAYSEYFMPYVCAEYESLDQTYTSKDSRWTPFSALPIVIVYNNKLVYEAVAPTGWQDLLDDRWKGKIAFANPSNSGSSYTTLATMIQILKTQNALNMQSKLQTQDTLQMQEMLQDQDESQESDILQQFANVLDGNILDGSGDVIDAVVKGTRLVGITLEETALKRIAAGADITMVYPVEGTSAVPDGSAITKNVVHIENAKKFIDFISSSDVQRLLVDDFYRRPVRADISVHQRGEQIKLINYDLDWASSNQSEILKQWSELVK